MLRGSCNCSSWCATCIRCTPSASGCKACGEGVSPTGHGEGACARGGAAPLSPQRILHSHLQRRKHTKQRENREEKRKKKEESTKKNTHKTKQRREQRRERERESTESTGKQTQKKRNKTKEEKTIYLTRKK